MFGGEAHIAQFAETAQAHRSIGLATQIVRLVSEVKQTVFGFGDHRPVDAGQAVLVDLHHELAALLDLGDGAEFQRRQFACPLTNAIGEIVAIDDEIFAERIATIYNDVDMAVAGVVMIDGDPIEFRAEVGFDLRHQLASVAGEVREIGRVFRRDDEPKLMAIIFAAFEKGIAVGTIVLPRIEPTALSVTSRTVALDIAQVRGGLSALACAPDGTGFDDDPAAAGLAVTPAVREVAGAHEGRATPSLHAPAGGNDTLTVRRPAGAAALGRTAVAGPSLLLPGDLANLAEKALGLSGFHAVGADAAGLRPEAIFVIGAHGRSA
jgi:hypothetical protein